MKKISILFLGLIFLVSCGEVPRPPSKLSSPLKILFIGNSYTYCNNGIDKALQGFISLKKCERVCCGGYTLETHFTKGEALKKIRETPWDFVVLQEQSQTPVFSKNKFYTFAKKFDVEIRKRGAKTILLMTWERPDSVTYGVTTENLKTSFYTLSRETGMIVAPAGLAFSDAMKENPHLCLYSQDGHPTPSGTYLAACVLYGLLFEKIPEHRDGYDSGVSSEIKTFLGQIAGKSLRLNKP